MIVVLALAWMIPLSTARATPPHNDTRDNSVEEVVIYHRINEANPGTIRYLSWTDVAASRQRSLQGDRQIPDEEQVSEERP